MPRQAKTVPDFDPAIDYRVGDQFQFAAEPTDVRLIGDKQIVGIIPIAYPIDVYIQEAGKEVPIDCVKTFFGQYKKFDEADVWDVIEAEFEDPEAAAHGGRDVTWVVEIEYYAKTDSYSLLVKKAPSLEKSYRRRQQTEKPRSRRQSQGRSKPRSRSRPRQSSRRATAPRQERPKAPRPAAKPRSRSTSEPRQSYLAMSLRKLRQTFNDGVQRNINGAVLGHIENIMMHKANLQIQTDILSEFKKMNAQFDNIRFALNSVAYELSHISGNPQEEPKEEEEEEVGPIEEEYDPDLIAEMTAAGHEHQDNLAENLLKISKDEEEA